MKVGDTILPWFRNHGQSYGLKHPYIFGQCGAPLVWAIWHRHTGEVVYIEPERHVAIGAYHCSRKCRELNGIIETPESRARINALHDMEA